MKYAIIKSGGKQIKAVAGESIIVEKINAEGSLEIKEVLAVYDGNKLHIGKPLVDGAVVKTTIQKQGNRRIIVELAGIQDSERARTLLQSTAQLEFFLVKSPEVTNDILSQIDKVVKGDEELEALAAAVDGEQAQTKDGELAVSNDQTISISELFGKDEVSSEDVDALSSLCFVLIELHRYEEAAEVGKKATKLNSGHKRAWNHLGLAYEGMGEKARAVKCFESCLKMYF